MSRLVFRKQIEFEVNCQMSDVMCRVTSQTTTSNSAATRTPGGNKQQLCCQQTSHILQGNLHHLPDSLCNQEFGVV